MGLHETEHPKVTDIPIVSCKMIKNKNHILLLSVAQFHIYFLNFWTQPNVYVKKHAI